MAVGTVAADRITVSESADAFVRGRSSCRNNTYRFSRPRGGMATESSIGESFRGIIEAIRDHAGVETAFGEPIEREGRTVIPVARVAYGFGGGFGEGAEVEADEEGDDPAEVGGSGGGGGGGAMTRPLGAIEVTDHETRFVPLGDRRRSLVVAGVAFVFGLLLGRSLARGE
jgi:uncharacterized spore protein YtfJ